MNRNAWRTAGLASLSVAVVSAALAFLAAGRFSWGTPEIPKSQCEALLTAPAAPALQSIVLHYQEKITNAIVREPQNTWSNLAFVFVGVLIGAHDRRIFSRLLGASLCALGLASGLYHASLLSGWRTVDVAAMGWVTFALGCVGVRALWRATSDKFSAAHSVIGIGGGMLAVLAAVFRNDVKFDGTKPFDTTYTASAGVALVSLAMLIGIMSGSRLVSRRPSWSRLTLMFAAVGGAIACQLGDHPGHCFCHPESAVQAHAVWHVLMAVAVALAYDSFATIGGDVPLVPRG